METPIIVRRRKRAHKLKMVAEGFNGKNRFKISGYYKDGKRTRKYFRTRDEAQTFMAAEEVRRQNLGRRAAHIDGALAEDALRAADVLKSTPYSILDAARVAAEAHAKLAPYSIRIGDAIDKYVFAAEQRRRSVTVSALADEFVANRRAKGRSAVYLRDLMARLARFKTSMSERIVAEITTRDIDRWIQLLNVGPQTQNNFRAVLSAAWTFAVRHGYASANIVQWVDKSQVVRDHVATFSVEQLTKLLDAAPGDCVPVLAIGAFAGLRPEEINKLRWEDIDFHDRTIRVNASAAKTRKKRFAEISHNLMEWLGPYAGCVGRVAPPNLQKLRRQTMKKAGIDYWPPDVLRHSFASAHYAAYKNPAHTALLLGHRDQNMLLTHYRDLMKPNDAARYWAIVPRIATNNIVPIASACEARGGSA
jgi:integrase/recombinase XerD